MNELESLEKLAFNCAKNIVEHIEIVINEYMQENNLSLEDWQQYGSYEEMNGLQYPDKIGIIRYKSNVFHKFRFNALGIISEATFEK